jgi:signal transduction histidine kinase
LGICDIGIVVLGPDGRVDSVNERAREFLNAESVVEIQDRLEQVRHRLETMAGEVHLDLPGLRPLRLQAYPLGGICIHGHILLLQDAVSIVAVENVLAQAAHHRSFASLCRDWAHDIKGILHIIRINHAVLSRVLPPEAGQVDTTVRARCLDAIPREIERLDHSLDLMLGPRPRQQESVVDVGVMCERLVELIAARASRQGVEVTLELTGSSKDTLGFADQLQGALLNLMINALEAMPDHGKLAISARGGATVTVSVRDSGPGIPPELRGRMWQPRRVHGARDTSIGLFVTRSVIEAHHGRIEYTPCIPRGSRFEITLPRTSTGSSDDDPRIDRR